jgi:DNA-directed RNA polymerase subunit N (RpoN/RPB10)
MEMPIRCFSCGLPVARYQIQWEKYFNEVTKNGESFVNKNHNNFFKERKINKQCCKRMILGYNPITSQHILDISDKCQ